MLVSIVDVGVEVAVMSRAARHPNYPVIQWTRVAGVSKVEGVTSDTGGAPQRCGFSLLSVGNL